MKPRWNPKWIGERGECAFMNAAMEHGFLVSKPFGDSARYDAIVDPRGPEGGRGPLWRIQVKCVLKHRHTGYVIPAHKGKPAILCGLEDADFLAAYVFDYKAWYIIPVRATRGWAALWLRPDGKSRGHWERYREAWELLREEKSR